MLSANIMVGVNQHKVHHNYDYSACRTAGLYESGTSGIDGQRATAMLR